MSSSFYVEPAAQGFIPTAVDGVSFRPDCFRAKGVELLILDPGHDDSTASRRSDAKVRGGGDKFQFLWPKIHEGNLNQVAAWMIYDLILKDVRLTPAERRELQTMIRFSRHPGEKTFGQYEKEMGYYAETQGTIDDTVTNRKARINYMMQNHRAYNPDSLSYWSGPKKDVSSKTVMLSVHANSSDFFDEGDVTWIIPPKETATTSATYSLLNNLVSGFSNRLGDYFESALGDSQTVKELKAGAAPSVTLSRIIKREHSDNLAMLSPTLGNSSTRKILTEGFVMNGKAGHLANLEITGNTPKKLVFRHAGATANTYDVAELYLAYARSIVQGLNNAFGCGN
jgi:hypothetical protein